MIKKLLIYLMLVNSIFANNINLKMKGSLDDDLFVLKANLENTKLISAYQMHNPNEYFQYIDIPVKTTKIYGVVDFNLNYNIKDNEILLVMLANEREEFRPEKVLYARTHYKSVPLYINNTKLIPSMMPEKKDMPLYPTWFGDETEVCQDKPVDAHTIYLNYNYYKLWENAIVNTGLIMKGEGNIQIEWYNLNGKKLFEYKGKVKKGKTINLRPIKSAIKIIDHHKMTEADGRNYINGKNNDKEVKKNACNDIKVIFNKKEYYIQMPYPMPYINRFFVTAI